MSTLTPSAVLTVRTVVTWTLRAIALYLLIAGTHLLLQRTFQHMITGEGGVTWQYIMEDGKQRHRPSIGGSFFLLGVALALLSAPLARWITPLPRDGCPRCGYTRDEPHAETSPDETRCPECGLRGANP